MTRKIFDIEIEELTLCKSPSNRKKFFIKKMEKQMDEYLEELKKFMAEEVDEGDEEGLKEAIKKALTTEELEKAEKLSEKAINSIKGALSLLNKYKADMTEEILKAMQTLAKYASYGYPEAKQKDVKKELEGLEKAGAKLSKTTRDQIAKVLALIKESPKAIAMLKTLLGQEVEKEEKTKGDEENLSEETLAKLEKAEEIIKAESERVEKEAKDLTKKKEKEIEDLKKDVEDLKKTKPVKKSIDDDGGGGDEDDEKNLDPWPSVPVIVRGEV